MASPLLVFLSCFLAKSVEIHSQTLYQPYGPKMCEAPYHTQEDFATWNFDKEHLICRLSVNTSEGPGLDTNSSHFGTTRADRFYMFTSKQLFLDDIPINKKKLSSPMDHGKLGEYIYDHDNSFLHRFRSDTGHLSKGMITNKRVTFQRYRKFKVTAREYDSLHVDERNTLVVLLKRKDNCVANIYNITTQTPRNIAVEQCSSTGLVLDKQERVIFHVKKKILTSIDYHGKHKKTFDTVRIRSTFYLEFQDQHMICSTIFRRNLWNYKVNRKSKAIQVTKAPFKCFQISNEKLDSIIKVKGLIIALSDTYGGILVAKGRKCYRMWQHLDVNEIKAMD